MEYTSSLCALNSQEMTGTIKSFLMNPKGEVDGFLIGDGIQVKFPPHMSVELTRVVKVGDEVNMKGQHECSKVFKARIIANVETKQNIEETLPVKEPDNDGYDMPHLHPKHGPRKYAGLQALSVNGKIETQLHGRHGEINGFVLSEGSIVHFDPRLADEVIEDYGLLIAIGSDLQASGHGTINSFGLCLEATDLSNQ